MFWTKRAHHCAIFQTLSALMKVLPILHAIPSNSSFLIPHSQGLYKFCIMFSLMKDNSSVSFQLKPRVLWTKIAHRSEIFGLLNGWVNIHQITLVFFGTKSVFSLSFTSLVNAMRDNSSVIFQLKLCMIFTKGVH